MFHDILLAGSGYIAGAFTPAVGRKIKAEFVKYAKLVVAKAEAEIKKV